jgi:hypothetical protein
MNKNKKLNDKFFDYIEEIFSSIEKIDDKRIELVHNLNNLNQDEEHPDIQYILLCTLNLEKYTETYLRDNIFIPNYIYNYYFSNGINKNNLSLFICDIYRNGKLLLSFSDEDEKIIIKSKEITLDLFKDMKRGEYFFKPHNEKN